MADFSDWDSRVFDCSVGTHRYTDLPRDIGDTEGLDVVFARGPYRGQLPDPRSTIFEIQVDLRCDAQASPRHLPMATGKDLPAILRIADETLVGRRWGGDPKLAPHAKKFYQEWLYSAQSREQVHVLREDDGCVGFVAIERSVNGPRLSLVAVDPAFQRRGYGERLLRFFLGLEGDAHRVRTWITNVAALNLYLRNGFLIETVECVEHIWLC